MSVPNDNQTIRYAGFWFRLLAYIIDCLLFFFAFHFTFGFLKIDRVVFFDYSIEDIAYYSLRSIIFALFLFLYGSTPGKKLFKIKVVANNGSKLSFWKALYRETVGRYILSFFEIGYLFILFNKDKKGLHDMICDTLVVRGNMNFLECSPTSPSDTTTASSDSAINDIPEESLDENDIEVDFYEMPVPETDAPQNDLPFLNVEPILIVPEPVPHEETTPIPKDTFALSEIEPLPIISEDDFSATTEDPPRKQPTDDLDSSLKPITEEAPQAPTCETADDNSRP